MHSGRLCVVFKPAYGKNAGDVSCNLDAIEAVIEGAGGSGFAVHPHDSEALYFPMPDGTGHETAETVVNCLNKLTDEDGKPLLEAEQWALGSLTLSREASTFDFPSSALQFS